MAKEGTLGIKERMMGEVVVKGQVERLSRGSAWIGLVARTSSGMFEK
jgi:hypothetical protein